jgi:hypothetical protein
MVSAIQEQRDSKEEYTKPQILTDADDSYLGYHKIYHSRRRRSSVL